MNRSLQFFAGQKKAKPNYRESKLQMAVMQHVKLYPMPGVLVFHPPNEGKRSAEATIALIKMGMLPGIADLIVDVPGQPAGYLELKAAGEHQTDQQRAFQQWCEETGRRYALADNIDDALAILLDWGALQPGCYQPKKIKRAA